MNEEVKHILILLENHIALSDDEDKIVLDYIKDLQNRIDKAVEYINGLYFDFYDYECDQLIVGKYMVNDLLDILKEKSE